MAVLTYRSLRLAALRLHLPHRNRTMSVAWRTCGILTNLQHSLGSISLSFDDRASIVGAVAVNLFKAARAYVSASILRRFVVGVVAVNAALVLFLGVEVVQRGNRQTDESRVTRATGVATLLGLSSVHPARDGNRAELQRLADAAMAVNTVDYAVFFDPSGRFLAGDATMRGIGVPADLIRAGGRDKGSGRLVGVSETHLEAAAPIASNNETIGWVRVGVVRGETAANRHQLIISVLLAGVVMVLLTGLVAFLTARSMTTRLSALAQAAQRFRLGDRAVRLQETGLDEVGEVGRGLNMMLDTLQASERSLQDAFRIAKVGSWRYVPSRGIVEISETLVETVGFKGDQTGMAAASFRKLLPQAKQRELGALLANRDVSTDVSFNINFHGTDGQERICWVEGRFEWCPLTGEPTLVGICQDVTERELATHRLRQAQKMEAVGQLTGGLAHDFNNLLAIIIGNLDLLQDDQTGSDMDLECLDEALQAALRGSALTQRLLAFSRRQSLAPQNIDLNALITDMAPLWRRTLGEVIDVQFRLAGNLWHTHADPAQVESAILNLVINARDSMPEGGFLGVATQNVSIDGETEEHDADIVRGDYCVIAVSDNGCGMAPEIAARAFEPFFTTKGVGEGSGLGLSMIYGFAKQSGGTVKIYTEAGHGTTVRLYLPRAVRSRNAQEREKLPLSALPVASNETVLVVEDNENVLRITERQLRELGYTVLTAQNGNKALELLETEPDIDLMFTDVIMPGGMNGFQLADQARQRKPNLKILHTSGFAGPVVGGGSWAEPSHQLLTKPYRKSDLASKVRELLDAA